MFKRILLPVDLTDRHRPALDVATELARQSGGEVVLLHVIEAISGLSMAEERDFYGRLERTAQTYLSRLSDTLQERKIPCRAEVLYGKRGPEIVRYAAATGVDLIVLTSPRLNSSNLAAGWGSLSYKVGLMCQCPVLLVK